MLKICIKNERVKRFLRELLEDDGCELNTFQNEEKFVFNSKSTEEGKNIIFFEVSEEEFEEFKHILEECNRSNQKTIFKFIKNIDAYCVKMDEKQKKRKYAVQ